MGWQIETPRKKKHSMEFEQYCWASPQPHQMDHNLIDDLFFGTFPESTTTPASALGNTNNNFMDDPCGNDNARIRRVTLTELTDEEVEDDDDWLMVSGDSTTDNKGLFLCLGV